MPSMATHVGTLSLVGVSSPHDLMIVRVGC